MDNRNFFVAYFGRIDATAIVLGQFVNQALHPIGIILGHLVELSLGRLDHYDRDAALVSRPEGTARRLFLQGIANNIKADIRCLGRLILHRRVRHEPPLHSVR